MRKKTKLDVTAVFGAALVLFAIAASCLQKSGDEEPPPQRSYVINEVRYGTAGDIKSPSGPRFGTSFTVPECRSVRVDLYNTDGDMVATVLDSTVCRGGWHLLPRMMWKVEETEEKGVDTVLIPLEKMDSGIYYFAVKIGSQEERYKSVLVQ